MLCFVGTNQGDGYIRQANSMQVNFKNSAASPDIDSSSSFDGARQPSSIARVVLAIDPRLQGNSWRRIVIFTKININKKRMTLEHTCKK